MRLSRVLALSTSLVAAAAGLLVAAAPAQATTAAHYVALGDSYSAGVGTDNYTSASGSCRRSPQGYPQLWANAHSVASFDFDACSGAVTTDVLNNQLGPLSSATTLASITIGGNDAGFTTVMEDCITESDSGCQSAITTAENYVNGTLIGRLDTLYAAIRSHAPNATVVVLGYPEFYASPGTCVVGMDSAKHSYINGGADALDSRISTEAGKYGFRFVDVRSSFAAGHEICGSSTGWLHSVVWTDIDESYHPTVAGYSQGYLPELDTVTG
ncbi:MAG TPA: SGNH/GDSL hydrolase family protein [Pseudonocardiaceae bacterium]|jgi:lysophospholipase L1-like esterase|nr:SGNH/GDSL hydrolase family protein [Pseudonocardiaceae bacterium]